jgi:hypothetical protein
MSLFIMLTDFHFAGFIFDFPPESNHGIIDPRLPYALCLSKDATSAIDLSRQDRLQLCGADVAHFILCGPAIIFKHRGAYHGESRPEQITIE